MHCRGLRRWSELLGGLSLLAAGCGDSAPGDGGDDATGTLTASTTMTMTGADSTGAMTGSTGATTDTGTTAGPTTGTGVDTTQGDSSSTGSNADPEPQDDDYFMLMDDAPLMVAAAGVLDNDTDPDGDPLTVDAFDAASAAGGTVDVQPDGSLTYTPPTPFWGTDAFGYTVGDGQGGSATATVRISVGPTTISASDVVGGVGGFPIVGEASNDMAGYSVAGAGDINGDGLADLVIGGVEANPVADDEGRAYVVFGKGDTVEVDLVEVAAGSGGFAIDGATTNGYAGDSVAVVGDVNNDGLADVAVGAPGEGAGTAYVVFGKAGTATVDLGALGTDGFAIDGETAGDLAGTAVAGAGDVNGDGLADIIVGASEAGGAGSAYVVFGKPDSTPVSLATIAAGAGAGFAINGEVNNDEAGLAVAGAGDIDGDGLADVVIGAHENDFTAGAAGRAYVVLGKATPTAVALTSVAAGAGGFAIDGEAAIDNAGFSVGGGGDVDGDGLADVVIGAIGSDVTDSAAGRCYVVFGKTDTNNVPLADVAAGTGGFAIDGEVAFDFLGWSVSNAGDINGDGLADVVLGAQGADFAAGTAGRGYVVYGKSSTATVLLSEVALGMGGYAIDGEAAIDVLGWSVGAAGDVNGDGLHDVIYGAYGSNAAATNAGRSYVVFGGDFTGLAPIRGTSGDDMLAGTVAIETLLGAEGNDELAGGGGNDILYGGPGDDVVALDALAFFRIDGGTGLDTLRLDGAGLTLDLSNLLDPVVFGIEGIDLTGAGDNALLLDARDLRAISSAANTLAVAGDAGDSLTADLTGQGFIDNGVVMGFTVYSNGVLTLLVDIDLTSNVQL